MIKTYFDYLMAHANQLEGSTPQQVIRFQNGIFYGAPRRAVRRGLIQPDTFPLVSHGLGLPADDVHALGGRRVG